MFLILFHVHQLLKMLLNLSFLSKTLIPKITENTWVQGAQIPVIQGSMSPNEQAITLLDGFASGNAKMDGDSVKHIPTILRESMTQTLNEIWGTLKWKKNTSGGAFCTKKAKFAQKSIERPLQSQTWKLDWKILFWVALLLFHMLCSRGLINNKHLTISIH